MAEEAEANTDTFSKVEILVERVVTTAVRVFPVSKHPRMVCLRVEILGCDIDGERRNIFYLVKNFWWNIFFILLVKTKDCV